MLYGVLQVYKKREQVLECCYRINDFFQPLHRHSQVVVCLQHQHDNFRWREETATDTVWALLITGISKIVNMDILLSGREEDDDDYA